MSMDEAVLSQLLLRGERARLTGTARAIRVAFRSSESPYWQLSLTDRDRFHQRLRAAAAAGGVSLEWARQGGDDRPLEGVRLEDVDKLASFLGVATVSTVVAAARGVLSPWMHNPRVAEILDAWAGLRQVRSMGPSSAPEFAAALQVIDAVRNGDGDDQVVRALSVALFRDSKRIEQLQRHLDVLTADALGAPARHWEEVYALLGLVKEPQPFLLAGGGKLVMTHGHHCPIVRPFLGVASHAIKRYEGSPTWVLTIENLTTFHQAARQIAGDARGLLIFTGGMPSPAWCRGYRAILGSLPSDIPAYHWGDVDEGGFRIAARIRSGCITDDRAFLPWRMDTPRGENFPEATPAEHQATIKAAVRAGWSDLAATLLPVWIEQEGIPVELP